MGLTGVRDYDARSTAPPSPSAPSRCRPSTWRQPSACSPAAAMRAEPTPVLRVTDRNGNVLIDNSEPAMQRVLAEDVADNVTDILQGVLVSGTAAGRGLDRPAAGKTGTGAGEQGRLVRRLHADPVDGGVDGLPERQRQRRCDGRSEAARRHQGRPPRSRAAPTPPASGRRSCGRRCGTCRSPSSPSRRRSWRCADAAKLRQRGGFQPGDAPEPRGRSGRRRLRRGAAAPGGRPADDHHDRGPQHDHDDGRDGRRDPLPAVDADLARAGPGRRGSGSPARTSCGSAPRRRPPRARTRAASRTRLATPSTSPCRVEQRAALEGRAHR